jgi:soluble lytic murein transglycosylase-like protein
MGALYLPPHIYDAIWVQSEHYRVDYYLIAAILEQESGFDPLAIGDGGTSFGLGQVNIHGAGYGESPHSLLDIDHNLEVAVAYLRRCIDAYPDDGPRAIAAYNRGITGAAPPFDPSADPYVKNVLRLRELNVTGGVFRRNVWYSRE